MKIPCLLFALCCQSLLLFPQAMGTKVFNFTSFTEDKKTGSALQDKRSSPQARAHPEYGILPFNAQCNGCVELIDRRTMYSRFFIDPVREGHTFSQQSYFPLHYLDKDGQWRTIDPLSLVSKIKQMLSVVWRVGCGWGLRTCLCTGRPAKNNYI
jgi:hypothetical protein